MALRKHLSHSPAINSVKIQSRDKDEPSSPQNMADVQRCMAWKKERAIEFKHPPVRLQRSKQRLNGSFSCRIFTASLYLSIILIKKVVFKWQILSKAKMFFYF